MEVRERRFQSGSKCAIAVLALWLTSTMLLPITFGANGAGMGVDLQKQSYEYQAIEEKKDAADRALRMEGQVESATYAPQAAEDTPLPRDMTDTLSVSCVEIKGNTLVCTEELLGDIPLVYNASKAKMDEADPEMLYDLCPIKAVIEQGQQQQVSLRTIQGFTQYLLSVYQEHGYGGIYIYVPAEAFANGLELANCVLPINVIEAVVCNVGVNYSDADGCPTDDPYMKCGLIEEWSPIKKGEPINQKKLDDYVNLLNENPDRYVSATISKGESPDTLNACYNVYEVDPWHYFLHIDNSGTKDRRYAPRFGLVSTNLTGRDDTLLATIQAPVDDRMSKNDYAAYASYDAPLFSQKLRLTLFGGRSEFDADNDQSIDFLGNGTVWGGTLTYNLLQRKNWFFDIYSGLSEERSKVTPSQFPDTFGQKVRMDLLTFGARLYRSDDLTESSVDVSRAQQIGGTGQGSYWDPATFTGARTDADRDFWIWYLNAYHYQYLNTKKIHRFLANVRYIEPNRRLIPAKMTTFGGMYTVRGYKESAIVADGGTVASFQYEYDIARKMQVDRAECDVVCDKAPTLRKFAPLLFFDYGRAKMESAVPGEVSNEELYSVGAGLLIEWGDHLSGGAFYGHPLEDATGTNSGDGRVNFYAMLKW